MRIVRLYLILFFLILLFVPYVMVTIFFSKNDQPKQQTEGFSKVLVYRKEKDAVESIDCFEYICNTVAGEMQSDSNPEALKAQAVACYTYMLTRMNYVNENPNTDIGHKGAYVCDDSSHCIRADFIYKINSLDLYMYTNI